MERKCGKCWKSPIFEGKLRVFISYLSKMRIVSMFYNFFILALFTACFHHFLFWRYLNSSMTRFSSGILIPFPNLNDLNSCDFPNLCCTFYLGQIFIRFLSIIFDFYWSLALQLLCITVRLWDSIFLFPLAKWLVSVKNKCLMETT